MLTVADAPVDLTEEELSTLWDSGVSEQLTAVLEGRVDLPQDVQPFDASLDVDLDNQR